MKMVVAVIKHTVLDDVRRAITDLGIHGMTSVDVKGFGRQKGHMEVYRGAQFEVKFLPKVKIEVAVPDAMVEPLIQAISKTANKGEIGDGKLFIYGLEEVVRIRTGERGEGAL